MNIMYCGDKNMENGLLISVMSLCKNTTEKLNIYVLTMTLDYNGKHYEPLSDEAARFVEEYINKNHKQGGFVKVYDVGEYFKENTPGVNMKTRFTPFCMLRLYADRITEIPDKILYLDTDVICRKDIKEFYETDVTKYEFIGVLDYYGSWFFRKKFYKRDYVNSGVLLLNMRKIKETGLFKNSREMCANKEMFMPDQSALNKLCKYKGFAHRKYNDQRRLHKDTVMQHFTTSFRLFPYFHAVTVKPWDVERVHSVLKLHEYDELLNEYLKIKGN